MNAKQLAAIVLIVGIVVLFQLGMSLRTRANVAAAQADAALVEETKLKAQLEGEEKILADLKEESKSLIDTVSEWEPFFALIEDEEAAETSISMKVRDTDMLNLSQRYEQVPHTINNKPNDSLPFLVRASLVFDDSYYRLLNWIGMMEDYKPTMRVGKVLLTRGSGEDGLQMELVLEIPLRAKAAVKK
jgi:hypothetical protein